MAEQEYEGSQAEQEDREHAEWLDHVEALAQGQFPQYPMWPATRNEIQQERFRQNAEWGGVEHDDTHEPGDWLEYITKQVAKAANALDRADDDGEVRQRFIKIAALAVAAIESYTRKDFAENG